MPAPATYATDRLDAPVRLLSARLWAGFAALVLAIAATAIWAALGTLPQHVSANGVLVHGAAVVDVRAPVSGSLASLTVAPGTQVRRGMHIGAIDAGTQSVELVAPADGTVMSLVTTPGTALLPGAPVVTIDPSRRPPRIVLLVTSPVELARLVPGQKVDLPGIAGGGRIASITPYAASSADLVARFGTSDLADGKQTWLVDVALDDKAGPLAPALSTVHASVLVGRLHPYQLAFGGSR